MNSDEERTEADACALVDAIMTSLVDLEHAKYKYHRDIVTFMETYKSNNLRKDYWEKAAGVKTMLRHVHRMAAPSYNTLKCLYYRIKRIREANRLTWEKATIYYAWGGLNVVVKRSARKGAPYLPRRRARRFELMDSPASVGGGIDGTS